MTPAERHIVAIYADESCLGNGRAGDNPGGAAGLVEWRNPRTSRLSRRDYWISEPSTTNNRMALRSVIEAMRGLSGKNELFDVVFTTDSRYIVDGMTSWVTSWQARGWKRKGGEIENLELWKEAVAAVSRHRVAWMWVRGHDGHPQNEYANDLAMRAARDQTSSGGFLPSGFDAWLAARESAKGIRSIAPFPDPRSFQPSR
jgi:ribonuclease HI